MQAKFENENAVEGSHFHFLRHKAGHDFENEMPKFIFIIVSECAYQT